MIHNMVAGLNGSSETHQLVRSTASVAVATVSVIGGATSDALGGSPVTTWVVVSAIAGGAATMFYKLLQRNDDRVDERIEIDMQRIEDMRIELETLRARASRAEIARAKLEERLRLLEEDV